MRTLWVLIASLLMALSLGCGPKDKKDSCAGVPHEAGLAPKCSPPPPPPVCGDGYVDWNEECDDGNEVGGDGCEPDCTIVPVCGNGVAEPGEECDDGNDVSGDGCEEGCIFLPVEVSARCFGSVPFVTHEGLFVLGEDGEPLIESTESRELDDEGTCRFYARCSIPGEAVFPLRVRPLPTIVAGPRASLVRLDQVLSLTSAIRRAVQIDEVYIEGGAVEHELSLGDAAEVFSAPALRVGPFQIPLFGESPIDLEFETAALEFDHEPATEFSVSVLGVFLEVRSLTQPVECTPIGEASVVFAPPSSNEP